MSFGFIDPWHAFLPRDGGHVLGFMGSGGKTSLQLLIAEIYGVENLPVVLTTTTRCEILPDMAAVSWDELSHLDSEALPACVYVHGGEVEPGKWGGLTLAQVDDLGGIFPDRIVLVEVDGAAKHPLKIHRSGEPVWPTRTSLALVVIGVSAVGGPVGEKVHRWQKVPFAPLDSLKDYDLLDWNHLGDLLLAEGGYLDQVPAGVPSVLALAGMAEQDDSIGLFEFVGKAMVNPAFPLTMFCSLGPDGWNVRTACVEPGEDS